MNPMPVEPSMIEMHKECPMTMIQPTKRAAKQTTMTMAALLLLITSATASAQNALGDGNALDANTGQSGRVNYTRPSFTNELSFRNAIATGNAPGGLSFRGDLGYRAAGEFSGDLGSDALFAFRRDSLYSGLAGMGIRGTDALQYQFALTTGATPPQNLMGNLSVARSNFAQNNYNTTNRSGTNPFGGTNAAIEIDQLATDLDLRGKQLSTPPINTSAFVGIDSSPMLGTLRSSSTYATTSNLQPALISIFSEGVDRKPIALVASPLLGITAIPLAQDEPKDPNPLVARPGGQTDPGSPGSVRLTTSYDEIVNQMRERVELLREKTQADDQSSIRPDETNDAWLIRQMQELRDKLYGQKPANDGDPASQTDPTDPSFQGPNTGDENKSTGPADPVDPLSAIADPQSPLAKKIEANKTEININPSPVELYDPTNMQIDPETLEVLRGSAAREIQQLLDPGADRRDIYVEHITRGQRMLKEERYFDAEERFTHALSVRPRDIPAQLGRLHAQIGAGMVLSASVNLQSLLSQHPEIIASRYTGELLPSKDRIQLLISRLEERAGITEPRYSSRRIESDEVRVSSAMVLAYLGYQIDDAATITTAIQIIRNIGSSADRRFASLLSQLWLESTPNDQTSDQANDQADNHLSTDKD